ncbi:MAG: CvpA family protein [Giesbergeria sp.]|uniref:CvpA family protein n=1 Tax=Giesbergeria sp. TaxID=2818473 RepID=UPI00260E70C3|nr:CvpA family protein [Giesbergeria sp.]MDD2609586.1 CvpA family protein [Giesbergeria sp.]
MTVLDGCVLTLLLGSMLLGAWRGLVFEVLSLLAWGAAVLLARLFAADAALHLPLGPLQGGSRHAASFAVVFIAAAFLCGWVATLGRQLVQVVGLRPVDRVLGGLFGAVRAALLLLVATLVLQWLPLQQQPWWRDSFSAPWLSLALQAVAPVLPLELLQNLSW